MGYQSSVYAGRYPRPDDNLGVPPLLVAAGAEALTESPWGKFIPSFGPTQEFLENQARRDQFMAWITPWRQEFDIAPQWQKDLYDPILLKGAQMIAAGDHSYQPAIDWMFRQDSELQKIAYMQLPANGGPANQRTQYQLPTTAGLTMPGDMEKWLPIVGIAASLFFLLKKG